MNVLMDLNPILKDELQRVAQIGYWKYRVDNNELQGSQIIYDIHEGTPANIPSVEEAINCYLPEYRSTVQEHFSRCLSDAIPYDLEVMIMTFKGNKKWVRTIGHPKVENGKVTEVFGVFQDISQKMALYEETIASKSRMDLILSSIKMGIWELDCTHNKLFWDDTIFDMIEMDKDSFNNDYSAFEKLIHEDDRDRVLKATQDSIEKNKPYEITYKLVTAKGNLIHIIARGRVFIKDGIKWFNGLSWDVTKEVQLQETVKAQEAKIAASARLASLGEMASGIAHEVNNPLAIIQTNADFLKIRIKKQTADETLLLNGLEKITETCSRIVKIIKGLRTFSRNSDNDPMEIMRLDEVLHDSINLVSQKFINSDIELKFEIESDLEVLGRPAQLGQVFLNLLSNSFDAIAGIEKKWIHIEVKKIEEKIVIRFSDSGKGINSLVQKKIFQPFFTTKEVGKGTGLGLSISKGIIEDHKGAINYDLTSDFTTFIIELPAIGQ